MTEDPVSNPGVTPTPSTPPFGPDHPRLAEGEETQEPKPFSLDPGEKLAPEGTTSEQPSPMEMAREMADQGKKTQMTPEDLGDKMSQLKTQMSDAKSNLQNPAITDKFAPDHHEALNRLVDKMNPDMRSIANNSKGEFTPPQRKAGDGPLSYVSKWLDGSQGTLSNALNYLSTMKKPDPASYLKLQYAVQRATQRGELFASIVGGSVSGVKTIMSTQLG